jgi:uncharacterized repeat protein (TIGR01451 family)
MRVRTWRSNSICSGCEAHPRLAWMIVLAVAGALISLSPACTRGGPNQNAKVAVHVMPHDGGRTCNEGMPEISGCADVSTTLAGCGDIDFFPVFLEVSEYQGIEYGVTWPGSYSCAFTSCSDLKIGDVIWPGDGVSHAWFDCQPGPVAIPGWAWINVNDSGHIRIVPYPRTGEITIGDCTSQLDDIEHVYCAGVCGALGDDPSGWGYNPLNIGKTDGLGGECTAPDQELIYTIRYDSPNFNLIHDVTLVDYLPPEVEFGSATDGGTYNVGTHAVAWDIGTLDQYVADSAQVIAHVPSATPYGTLLTNRCRITGLETGPSEVEMLTTVCTGGFQPLTITKSDGLAGDGTVPGAGLTYTLTFANLDNPASVHDVILTDLLPPEIEFVSATGSAAYDPGGHAVTWDVGTLGSGASDTMQIQVVVSATTDPGALLINRCRIVCSEAPAAEMAETTMVFPTVFEPLILSKRARGPYYGPIFPGDDITYTITYRNSTNHYAVHGVGLRDELPAQTSFVSAGGGGTYDGIGHAVTWDIGTLAPDEAGTRQVVVNAPLETEPGTIIANLCEIFSDEAPRTATTEQTYISGSGECMMAVHVRPHQQTTTCAGIASEVTDCGDIETTTDLCDVDVFPVFFEIFECRGMKYGLTWPSEWGEMVFTSCSDLTEGSPVLPGDGVSHSWGSCRTDYLVVPGYGRLTADSPGLIEIVPHPATGIMSFTTCSGYEYWVQPMGGYAFRAGACGATGDEIQCGGPQRTVPTTWSSIKAMFK